MPIAPVTSRSGIPSPQPQFSSDALQYQGHPYVYGGGSPDGWDCSGYMNWVFGHDFNMILPGGTKAGFDGKSHGPVVVGYATWKRAMTIPASLVQAGDLCIWVGTGPNGHIGIATSNTHMISALNPALGTIVTPINGTGPAGAPLIHRRITSGGTASLNTLAKAGCLPGAALIARILSL